MKMRQAAAAAMAGFAGLALTASAGIKEGQSEVGVMGTLTSMPDDDSTSVMVQLTVNQFVSENFSLGMSTFALWAKSKGADDMTSVYLSGRGDFYIGSGAETVPYIGARAGIIVLKAGGASNNAFQYGPQAGLKHFMTESTSLNAELQYTLYKIEGASENAKVIQALVGFSVYF